MTILGSEHYPTIRAALDTSLDSAVLPDAIIALPIYLVEADLEVKARDAAWASRTDDDLTRLQNAAIYLTAARLARALPQIKAETHGTDYRYDRQLTDPAALEARLRAAADAALTAILAPSDTTPSMPTMFGLATGRRGR